jgi:hypothetical protein
VAEASAHFARTAQFNPAPASRLIKPQRIKIDSPNCAGTASLIRRRRIAESFALSLMSEATARRAVVASMADLLRPRGRLNQTFDLERNSELRLNFADSAKRRFAAGRVDQKIDRRVPARFVPMSVWAEP